MKCATHPDHIAADFVVLYERRPILHRSWQGAVCQECLRGALEMLARKPAAGPRLLIGRIDDTK